ncbi:MAG TPA: oligosaccharide flippase family protein, partial [Chloroflexota bacterium]|nr:oligosaccharide flippase family protein [Chloroflexota bacterium]
MLAVVLVARRLGSTAFGEYSLIGAFALIFSYLADFGLVSLLIRQFAQSSSSEERLLSQAVSLQLWLSTVSAGALIGFGFLLQPSSVIRLGICLAAAGLFLESLGRPFTALILSRRQIPRAALIVAGTSVFNTALLLGVL